MLKYKFDSRGRKVLDEDPYPNTLVISNEECFDELPTDCPFCGSKNDMVIIVSGPKLSGYVSQKYANYVCLKCNAKFVAFARDIIEPMKIES